MRARRGIGTRRTEPGTVAAGAQPPPGRLAFVAALRFAVFVPELRFAAFAPLPARLAPRAPALARASAATVAGCGSAAARAVPAPESNGRMKARPPAEPPGSASRPETWFGGLPAITCTTSAITRGASREDWGLKWVSPLSPWVAATSEQSIRVTVGGKPARLRGP